jgi:hypothetical protein
MAHSYDVGTKAWQPDATEGWVASEVTSKKVDGDKIFLVFELANGEVGPSPEAPSPWSCSISRFLIANIHFYDRPRPLRQMQKLLQRPITRNCLP